MPFVWGSGLLNNYDPLARNTTEALSLRDKETTMRCPEALKGTTLRCPEALEDTLVRENPRVNGPWPSAESKNWHPAHRPSRG